MNESNGRMSRVAVAILIVMQSLGLSGLSSAATVTEPLMRYSLGKARNAAYSPDGKLLATCGGIGVTLRNTETQEIVRIFKRGMFLSEGAAFSPDGSLLAAGGSNGELLLFEVATGELIREFIGHIALVQSIEFSPDGTKLLGGDSASNSSKAILWDVATGTAIHILTDFINPTSLTGGVSSLGFRADGAKFFTTSFDFDAKIYDTATGAEDLVITHAGPVGSGDLSADGTLIITGHADMGTGNAGQVTLWDATTGAEIRTVQVSVLQSVLALRFSSDASRALAVIFDSTAKIIDVATGSLILDVVLPRRGFFGAWSPDDTAFAAGGNDIIREYDATTGEEIARYPGYAGRAAGIAVNPDASLVVTSNSSGTAQLGGTLFVWDARTGELLTELVGQAGAVECVDISPDGSKLASGGHQELAVWDLETGQELIRNESAIFTSDLHFSPDGATLLTNAFFENDAQLRDAETLSLIRTFTGHTDEVLGNAFSGDGSRIVTGSADDSARVWDAATGALIQTFVGHLNDVDCVAFSLDGTKIATGSSDDTARIWDVGTGATLHTLANSTQNIRSVEFSPDGSAVLSGGAGTAGGVIFGQVTLWDALTGTEISQFNNHTDFVNDLVFSSDATRFFTAGRDGMSMAWDTGITPVRTEDKLIIVAGGGQFPGNTIHMQTQAMADFVFEVGQIQGYSPDRIQYLSAFETPGSDPRVDGAATSTMLTSAIQTWAADASSLAVYMIGDTAYDDAAPEWAFVLDATGVTSETITAAQVDSLLDGVQTGGDPVNDVFFIVDSSYSGGFVTRAAGAPAGTNRLVIASAAADGLANFGPPGRRGDPSFSLYFLTAAMEGETYLEMFNQAFAGVTVLRSPRFDPQTPFFDDDGDGVQTAADGDFAATRVFGSLPDFGLLLPEFVGTTADDLTLDMTSSVPLEVVIDVDPGVEITSVEVIVLPAGDPGSGLPITDQIIIALVESPAPGAVPGVGGSVVRRHFTGTLDGATLPGAGQYALVYSVARDDGLGLDLVATSGFQASLNLVRSAWESYR